MLGSVGVLMMCQHVGECCSQGSRQDDHQMGDWVVQHSKVISTDSKICTGMGGKGVNCLNVLKFISHNVSVLV